MTSSNGLGEDVVLARSLDGTAGKAASIREAAHPPSRGRRSVQIVIGSILVIGLIALYSYWKARSNSATHPTVPPVMISTVPATSGGECWRPASSDAFPHRAERHRGNRPPPAYRNREEECNPDGRLRPRSGARRKYAASRSDLSGVPASVPPDSNDDNGSVVRRVAANHFNRHGLGVTPPTRHRYCRRLDLQSGAYAVHDAGGLT